MISEKQLAANRRNSLLSTGPKTEEGKKVSSLNAARHALTRHINVLTPEESGIHDQFCAAIVASLAPESAIERQLAQSVAEDNWRLNRARSIENNIFALVCSFEHDFAETENPAVDLALSAARAFIADPHRFQLLTIYEQRIHRTMQKGLQQLQSMQAARREMESRQSEQRRQALEDAALLLQLNETKGLPYDAATEPALTNGFVFSNNEIGAFATRRNLLKQARLLDSLNRNSFAPDPGFAGRAA